MNIPIAIHGVGLVSPLGVGFDAFRTALRNGRCPEIESAAFAGPVLPDSPGFVVPGFDARAYLGEKATKPLDRSTLLSMVACGDALSSAGIEVTDDNRRRIGVVLGMSGGSLKSIGDFVRSTYLADPPYVISALEFPNTVMNCAASQCAIWYKLRGVNSTVCAGRLSGLAALQYASRMLRLGHADTLIAGAVEEYCDYTAWAQFTLAEPATPPLGEGAAVFVLSRVAPDEVQSAGLAALKVCSAPPLCGTGADPDGFAAALRRTIDHTLQQAGITAADLSWWSAQRSGPAVLDAAERAVVDTVRTSAGAPLFTTPQVIADRIGQTNSAGTAFQLAALLAMAPSGFGLITAADITGGIGCAIVRQSDGDGPC